MRKERGALVSTEARLACPVGIPENGPRGRICTCNLPVLSGTPLHCATRGWRQGIHVAHVIIDGIIGDADDESPTEDANHEPQMHADAIADVYWQLIRQERSAWTLELDLRPNREKFFE